MTRTKAHGGLAQPEVRAKETNLHKAFGILEPRFCEVRKGGAH